MSSPSVAATDSPLPEHSWDFRKRRGLNWFLLGLMYATFYMGRYNFNKIKPKLWNVHHWNWSKAQTGFWLFTIPFWVYAASVLLNGPLADRAGGRRAILFGGVGAILANVVLGCLCFLDHGNTNAIYWFALAFAANYYFQSFGALSVVKVNAPWFHVRERGTFGGIFGSMIQSGYLLALGVGGLIAANMDPSFVFFIPAAAIAVVWFANFLFVRDSPGAAGLEDFDTGDATSKDDGKPVSLGDVAKRIFTNKILITIALAEICIGFARQGLLAYYTDYLYDVHKITKDTLASSMADFVFIPAGGMVGGIVAGRVSDRLFGSRRPPVALLAFVSLALTFLALWLWLPGVLEGAVGKAALAALPATRERMKLAWFACVLFGLINFSVNAGHGILSGTAAMDFGGKRAAATAAGMLDGFSYLGAGIATWLIGGLIDHYGYGVWPLPLMGAAVLGALIMTRIWNARPRAYTKPEYLGQPEGASKAPRRASRETQSGVLAQVVERAGAASAKGGLVVFDLDSTILDNRPRQARLLSEWARVRGDLPDVANLKPEHVDGWDLRVALRNVGIPAARADVLYPEAKAFWRERFFTSEYCELDVAIPGTRSFLRLLQARGMRLAYVTGRHEGMRAGTLKSFEAAGFPLPAGDSVILIMKPRQEDDDDVWKRVAHETLLRPKGPIVAAFDNEPIHANDYKKAFPDALVVHLDTDNSGRPVRVLDEIPSIFDFVQDGSRG